MHGGTVRQGMPVQTRSRPPGASGPVRAGSSAWKLGGRLRVPGGLLQRISGSPTGTAPGGAFSGSGCPTVIGQLQQVHDLRKDGIDAAADVEAAQRNKRLDEHRVRYCRTRSSRRSSRTDPCIGSPDGYESKDRTFSVRPSSAMARTSLVDPRTTPWSNPEGTAETCTSGTGAVPIPGTRLIHQRSRRPTFSSNRSSIGRIARRSFRIPDGRSASLISVLPSR